MLQGRWVDEGLHRGRHLEQLIEAECAAWLALLEGVPDYPDAVVDLTPAQRELVDRYEAAHAVRARALR